MSLLGYSCPSPSGQCHGAQINSGLGSETHKKYHQDSLQTLNCFGKYLISQGYTRRSRREYKDPKTGEILVLCKKPGLPVRSGKGGKEGGKTVKGKRAMGQPRNIVVW